MSLRRGNMKWMVFFLSIVLFIIAGSSLVLASRANQPHIPPCEAMRPYLRYHGTIYYAMMGATISPSELGNIVTTIGDGTEQAQSCLAAGTTIYAVKGYPTTTHLASSTMLFQVAELTPSPTSSAITRIPPCEAMRPYLRYQGTLYQAVIGTALAPSDLGNVVTTVGSGAAQAQSCLREGTSVYSVKGYATTSRLAANLFDQTLLFEAVGPAPSSSAQPKALA